MAWQRHSAFSVTLVRGLCSPRTRPFYITRSTTAPKFAENKSTISPEVGCRLQQHEEPDTVPLPLLFANFGNSLAA
jgi:hypothetical protein